MVPDIRLPDFVTSLLNFIRNRKLRACDLWISEKPNRPLILSSLSMIIQARITASSNAIMSFNFIFPLLKGFPPHQIS